MFDRLDELNNDILAYLFTFFKPSEQKILSQVSKKWHKIITEDKFTALKTYQTMKIISSEEKFDLTQDLVRENQRLEKLREKFMAEIEALPYWFGDISRNDAEDFLKEKGLVNGFLLRQSSIPGTIAVSKLIRRDGPPSYVNVNRDPSGAILLPNQKKFKVSHNKDTTVNNDSNFEVGHYNYVIIEDTDKRIRLKPNNSEVSEPYSINRFDYLLRFDGTPVHFTEENSQNMQI